MSDGPHRVTGINPLARNRRKMKQNDDIDLFPLGSFNRSTTIHIWK